MANEEKQKELEARYTEHQIIEQQLKQFQNQVQALDNQLLEVNTLLQGIDDLNETKKNTDMLFPIANGIFMKGKFQDNSKVLVNIGAGIVVENTIEETKKLMQKQLKNIEKLKEETINEMQKLIINMSKLEEELEKLISK